MSVLPYDEDRYLIFGFRTIHPFTPIELKLLDNFDMSLVEATKTLNQNGYVVTSIFKSGMYVKTLGVHDSKFDSITYCPLQMAKISELTDTITEYARYGCKVTALHFDGYHYTLAAAKLGRQSGGSLNAKISLLSAQEVESKVAEFAKDGYVISAMSYAKDKFTVIGFSSPNLKRSYRSKVVMVRSHEFLRVKDQFDREGYTLTNAATDGKIYVVIGYKHK